MPFSFFKNLPAIVQDIFWPIKREETKLFALMALMMFCILFNFASLRSLKDGLVVPSIGAEVISFLKLWLVFPSTVLFTIFYVQLSNIFNFEYVFYIVLSIFLAFFLFFAYVIYPHQEIYHPNPETIILLTKIYPNFQWFIKIYGKWSYALMYIFSELWSAVVINLMFWQFANHIFDTEKAKRFYPLLGMIGNMGLVVAGNILVHFSIQEQDFPTIIEQNCHCEKMLKSIISIVVFSGFVAILLFKIINSVLLKSDDLKGKFKKIDKETKTKLSLKDSIKLIINSKYIGYIVLLVFCYGLLINLLEGPWKAKVREIYPNIIDYVNFMGKFNIWMGISSVIFMVIGSNILRRVSWLMAAILTPAMLCFTGLFFFTFVILSNYINFANFLFSPIYAAVFVGAVQNILSKSTKYSLFDSTKEMAYIPLSMELKTKGKATVEIIGTKFGKSAGALIQSSIFVLFPTASFDSIAIYLLIVFAIFLVVWVRSIICLNKQYLNKLNL